MRKPVDIIIPIYNAYDDLVKCIGSILNYTDLIFDSLILINDCSSDSKIKPYLDSLCNKGINVIHNKNNMGFSNNVNKGMRNSEERDVILLNSDTIVTRGWVDKLYRCAYSKEEIGTVTPLSNSATLCSIPEFCMDNKMPANADIDELSELVERCSNREYPRITVAVGFCMYIKRNVINEVGFFDADTFERGYGEENDFCNRAEQFGYIHVMCDDTFIYHKGTVSFLTEEKQKLIEAHNKILQERYSEQMKNNHNYCMTNPHQHIRNNISYCLDLQNNKKNLLYMVHLDINTDNPASVGGTQYHVIDMIKGMQEYYNIYVIARDSNKIKLYIFNEDNNKTIEFDYGIEICGLQYTNSDHLELFKTIISVFKINLVHVQHTHKFGFDIFYAAKEMGVPVYLTLHDYYYINPNLKLYSTKAGFCNTPELVNENKKELLSYAGYWIDEKILDKWMKNCSDIFDICDKIFTPSEYAANVYSNFYPELSDKVKVISHGYMMDKFEDSSATKSPRKIKAIAINFDCMFNKEINPNQLYGWTFCLDFDMSQVDIYFEFKDSNGYTELIKAKRCKRSDVAKHYSNDNVTNSGFVVCKNLSDYYGKVTIRLIYKVDGIYYTNGKKYYVRGNKQTKHIKIIKNNPNANNNSNFVNAKRKLNIAFIGAMTIEKGSRRAVELVENDPGNFNWYVFGNIGDEKLSSLRKENLFLYGGYDKHELKSIIDKYDIDIICILSEWGETFCYTLTEAFLLSVPVLANDIGAVGERLKNCNCGWLVDVNSGYEEILEVLNRIADNKNEYNKILDNLKSYKSKTIEEMCQEYNNYYDFETPIIYEGKTEIIFNSMKK